LQREKADMTVQNGLWHQKNQAIACLKSSQGLDRPVKFSKGGGKILNPPLWTAPDQAGMAAGRIVALITARAAPAKKRWTYKPGPPK
jgi:hypothetical protein